MSERNHWVDYAKAIGIILVVYGHVARGLMRGGIEMPEHYRLIDSVIYTFHMPLFFFLSGLFFFDSLHKKGRSSLLFSKVDTIIYPYIIWSILQGLIEASLARYTNGDTTLTEVFSLMWEPRAQFWFLYVLFLAFILATALFSTASTLATLAFFALSAVLYLSEAALPDISVLKLFAQNLVFFAFGMLFSLTPKTHHLFRGRFTLALALIFIGGELVFHIVLGATYEQRGIASLMLAIVAILFVSSLSGLLSTKPSKLMLLIGSSSMAIYLMHILAGSGTRVILKRLFGVDSFAPHLIAGCLIGIFIPLLIYVLMNRFKVHYLFSAPLSKWVTGFYNRVLRTKISPDI